jgi:DNA polymerase III subunit delta'
MGFDLFQGNPNLLDTLKNQLQARRLPHSLLFVGPEGVGKRTLALCLAKAVNCPNSDGTDFCGHCNSCRKIEEGMHPDVREVEPEGQFIKIEQMRELSREVFFSPFEAKRRFFLINHAERLKMEAANSILKTLEEPPKTSHLILLTPRSDELLGTIRSRCHTYRFSPLPLEAMEKLLHDKSSFSQEHQNLLIRLCNGSIGKALQFNLDPYLEKRDELLVLLSHCLPNLSYTKVSRVLTPLSKAKDAFPEYLEILYSLLRDLVLIQLDRESPIVTNQDIASQLYDLAIQVKMPALEEAIHVLDHLESGAKRNINRSLGMDQFVLKLSGRI